MITLFSYQELHVARLVELLKTNKVVGDISPTGSGKTITSLFVAKQMDMETLIVCPPTLINYWEEHVVSFARGSPENSFAGKARIVSSFSLRKVIGSLKLEPCFVIVDECHYFKNLSARTGELIRLIQKTSKCLLMSATPFDDIRQHNVVTRVMETSDISSLFVKMPLVYASECIFQLLHVNENQVWYKKGYSLMNMVGVQERRNFDFGGLYGKGFKLIHSSLTEGLCLAVRKALMTKPNIKVVVVIHFKNDFEIVKTWFPNALVINGYTPSNERTKNIGLFQQPNLIYRLIIVSDQVGGVGIELDDKDGRFPRELFMLPVRNLVDFFQISGRVNRANTRSNSRVTVIQPMRKKSFFRYMLKSKSRATSSYDLYVPNFKSKIYEHECLNIYKLGLPLSKDLLSSVLGFTCTCVK